MNPPCDRMLDMAIPGFGNALDAIWMATILVTVLIGMWIVARRLPPPKAK